MASPFKPTTTDAPTAGKPSVKARAYTYKRRTSRTDYGPYTEKWNPFPPEQQAVMEGYLMASYDPTVSASINIMQMMIASRLGSYSHPDPHIQQFVQDMVDHLEGGPRMLVNGMLSCLWAGFAVAEKVWQTTPQGWTVRNLNVLHPFSMFDPSGKEQGIRLDPTTGSVNEVWQFGDNSSSNPPVKFAASDVIYWPLFQQFREQVYGRRLTDRARRNWFIRVKLEGLWNKYLAKYALPTMLVTVPKAQVMDNQGTNAGMFERSSMMVENAIKDMPEGSGLVFEVGTEEKGLLDVRLLESDKGTADAFHIACRYHISETFKALLMSPTLIEEPQHGSRAQSKTALDLFMDLIKAVMTELGEVLITQLVSPVIWYNFGPQHDFGEWTFDPPGADDLEVMAQVVNLLLTSGAITPTVHDEAGFRRVFGEAGFAQIADAMTELALPDLEAAARTQSAYGRPPLPVGKSLQPPLPMEPGADN